MRPSDIDRWSKRNAQIRQVARSARCDLALRYFDIRQSTNVEDARWQPFQIELCNRTSMLSSTNKSRQIGFSFTVAGDELFDGMIKGQHTVVMLSFNLEEAREKIVYAKKWWDARHPNPASVPLAEEFDEQGNWRGASPRRIDHWPELLRDNSLELAWSNGFRMISHPCRPPRGKKASVVLDEFAHYMQDGPIMTAALPMITRGRGRNRLTIGSTPLGADGKFWDIHTNAKDYPDYDRFDYGWWEIEDLCSMENRLACLAGFLQGTPQATLVKRYGTRMAKMIYSNVLEEDFEQEYGLQFLDALHAFISWDLIKACYPDNWVDPDADESEDFDPDTDWETVYKDSYVAFKARADKNKEGKADIDSCLNAVFSLADAVKDKKVTPNLTLAYDCGRDNDPSELTIFESDSVRHKQRLLVTMPLTDFDSQEAVLRAAYENLPIRLGLLDKGGVGRQMAERMETRYGSEAALGVWFTPERKERWALNLRNDMERKRINLIPDRDQEQQFHSIRRRATSAKHMIYELEATTSSIGGGQKVKHHGDKFWASAMAVSLCDKFGGMSVGGFVPEGEERKTSTDPKMQMHSARKHRVGGRTDTASAMDRVASKMGSGR